MRVLQGLGFELSFPLQGETTDKRTEGKDYKEREEYEKLLYHVYFAKILW